MKKIFFTIYTFFIVTVSFAQMSVSSLIKKSETYILENKIDSALLLLEQTEKTDYVGILLRIAKNEQVDYKEHQEFINSVQTNSSLKEELINLYLEDRLKEPANKNLINIPYVQLKFKLIYNYRNDNKLDLANKLNSQLKNYVNQFDKNSTEVKRAMVYVKTHDGVLLTIQKKGRESVDLGLEVVQLAEETNDTGLIILAYSHLFTPYTLVRDLDKCIQVIEKARELEELRSVRTGMYESNLILLLDVYMYKGGRLPEVFQILKQLYNNKESKVESYEMIARYLSEVKEDPKAQQEIFTLTNTSSVVEFSQMAIEEVEGKIYDNNLFNLLNASAKMLRNYNEYELAMKQLYKSVLVTRKIYGEELSQSLANFETQQVRKEKELAIAYEKKQTSLYALIAGLVGILSLISVLAFVRKRKQAKLLAENKKELEKTLQEKQLLLKEVHHRVKNNFQIVSSLLELQSKGIEDEKARELASEGKNRIRSMALIHQKLYQNDDLVIYFDEYIQNLVKEIKDMYGEEKDAKISLKVPKIAFDVDTAIPLGLIINELVTNSFKYGLGQLKGELDISMSKTVEDGTYQLAIKDNGKGMPEDFNFVKAKSLGLRLVKSLTKQLHGSVEYINQEGALFTILFKDSIAREAAE